MFKYVSLSDTRLELTESSVRQGVCIIEISDRLGIAQSKRWSGTPTEARALATALVEWADRVEAGR